MLQYLEETLLFAVYFIAGFFATLTGASSGLIVMVQYLFFIDLFVGLFSAVRRGKYSWIKFWQGIKKIVSLYFSLWIVGVGVEATQHMVTGSVLGYQPSVIFNAFVFLLIIFELQSINHHLAKLDLQINKILDVFLTRLSSGLFSKAIKTIDSVSSDSDSKSKTDKDY